MERIKVTVEIDDKRVTIEGPEVFVREEVHRLTQRQLGSDPVSQAAATSLSERAFVDSKRPRNHAESVAVLGFWLHEHGLAEFNEDDIRRLYIRAGVRPPKVVAQALRDAKNRFDYIETGGRRGSFRLTDHGDRTVRFDLPRVEESTQ